MSQIAFLTAKTKTLAANGTITGGTNAGPIVITSTAHGLETGDIVQISGVVGLTAANGRYTITKVDANSYSLNNSKGNAAYSSGGTAVHIGFACAAVLVDNTVFTSVPDFTLKFAAESMSSITGVRAEFTDSADSSFVTEQPLVVFALAGTLGLANGRKYSAKKADLPDARMAASGDNMRLKMYLSGGPGATGQFSAWIEY